ncbi:hypothetical protein BGW41_002628 [Actinomortierella wolfii]|nr:hypothetical protein BGW41_002628 [Actinomortierella wolfii]
MKDHVVKACYESFTRRQPTAAHLVDNVVHVEGDETEMMTLDQIRVSLFGHIYDSRWASSESVQEPYCVSFSDHGLGTSRIEKIGHMLDDLQQSNSVESAAVQVQWDETADALAGDQQQATFAATPSEVVNEVKTKPEEVENSDDDEDDDDDWLEDDAVDKTRGKGHTTTLDADRIAEVAGEVAQEMFEDQQHKTNPKMMNRRERTMARHHHHHRSTSKNNKIRVMAQEETHTHHEKRQVASKVDAPLKQEALMHQQLSHAEHTVADGTPVEPVLQDVKSAPASGGQRVLMQVGSSDAKGEPSAGSDGTSNAGQEADKEALPEAPTKSTLLIAVVPIALLIAAIAGFTAYRRHYENPFNQGGRNDTRDGFPSDEDYHRRDVPLRKGSPIHFDRTFINAMHSPPPAATYLHDPESNHHYHHHHAYRSHSNSRHHSPTTTAATAMARPPPSAGSLGKSRFQELNRSYDFSAGLRSIRQAFSRSQNASKEAGINYGQGTHSSGSLHEGGGGSSSDAIYPGMRPAPNYALGVHRSSGSTGGSGASAVALGKQRAIGGDSPRSINNSGGFYGATATAGSSSHHNIQSMAGPSTTQEHAIIWGQYTATDDDPNLDSASQSLAAHLSKRSVSSNSLTLLTSSGLFGGSKYTHHQPCTSATTAHSPYVPSHASMGTGAGTGNCPHSPTDSIGNCLSPSDSPSISREEHMRRQSLLASQYAFDSDEADSYSSRDMLFDAREHMDYDEKTGTLRQHQQQRASGDQQQKEPLQKSTSFFDRLRAKKSKDQTVSNMDNIATTTADDDEMDMYLRMEKEISPEEEAVFDVLKDDGFNPRDASLIIQKSASLSRNEIDEKSEIRALTAEEEKKENSDKNMTADYGEWNEKVGLEPETCQSFEEKKDKHLHQEESTGSITVEVEEAAAAEETHVLGSASPEWSHRGSKNSSETSPQVEPGYEAAPVIPTAEPNRQQLQSTFGIGNVDEEEVEEAAEDIFDRDEWEENPKKPENNSGLLRASGSHGSSNSLHKKKKKSKKSGKRK